MVALHEHPREPHSSPDCSIPWSLARSMTLYLWHLTAMFIVIGIVTLAYNVDIPQGWSLT